MSFLQDILWFLTIVFLTFPYRLVSSFLSIFMSNFKLFSHKHTCVLILIDQVLLNCRKARQLSFRFWNFRTSYDSWSLSSFGGLSLILDKFNQIWMFGTFFSLFLIYNFSNVTLRLWSLKTIILRFWQSFSDLTQVSRKSNCVK